MTTTLRRTCATKKVTSTSGKIAPRIRTQKSTRATRTTITASVVVRRDLIIVKEIMKMIVEDATGTATDPAIVLAVILEGKTR